MRTCLLLTFLASASIAFGGTIPVESWELDRGETAQGSATLNLDRNKTGAQAWGRFPAVGLPNGATITVSCPMKFDHAVSDPSPTQLRLALLGAPAGAGNELKELRGIIVDAGINKGHWNTQLRERNGPSGRPCILSNTVYHGSFVDPGPATSDTSMRVVLSVRRDGPSLFTISGFWGPHAFTFERVATKSDYDRFDCVAVLNGASSGVRNLTIENCRVTPP